LSATFSSKALWRSFNSFSKALGLKDQIAGVGATFGAADKEVAADYAELNDLGSDYISKETALSVDPDLIFGRGGLFDNQDWGVGTVDSFLLYKKLVLLFMQ